MALIYPEEHKQDIELYELRECRLCTHMIANHGDWGRRPSKDDPKVCEVCEYDERDRQFALEDKKRGASQHMTGIDHDGISEVYRKVYE